jgi:chromosome segregation ATPase
MRKGVKQAAKWLTWNNNWRNKVASWRNVTKKIASLEWHIAAQAAHLSELENRIAQTSDVIATLTDEAMRTEASVKAWASDQLELREMVTGMVSSVNRAQSELDEKLAIWQVTLDEHKDIVDQLSQQWLSLSNQYKEARMAVQNFANWQKQLEQQKRESGEIARQEMNRPLITAAADPHSPLSVIDAIERGLITIDYESESDAGS